MSTRGPAEHSRTLAPAGDPEPFGSLGELARLPRDLALGRLRYAAKRTLFTLPLYRLTLTGRNPTALRVSPSDPWPGNAAAGAAIVHDQFALAGTEIPGPSPLWHPLGANTAWRAALHGFAWLRDLRATGGDAPRRKARELVADWMTANGHWDSLAWHPVVTGQRLAHWLGQYEFFAASAEIEFRHRLLGQIARQARYLGRVLPAGLAGADAVAALKGLVYAGICLPGGEGWLGHGLALLRDELARQILSDGGHVERSPSRHLAVLRDLIDLRALFHLGGLETPPELQAAVERMAPMLRLFQHGDGGLALFNDSNEEEGWQVDMALQRANGRGRPLMSAPESGFERLQAGRTLVLVDAGPPPPPGFDRHAHAGTLSLEMSVGRERLIVNCGAHPGDPAWRGVQRITAAHSTLVIDDANSSELRRDGSLGRRPRSVTVQRNEVDGHILLDMSHDGYRSASGHVHHRSLYLGSGGDDLRGEDRLEGAARGAFSIHFHLHPAVQASETRGGDTVLLRLPKGGGWRMRAKGARLSLEDSVYLGRAGELRASRQVVLTGEIEARETTVKWALQREGRPR